MVPDLYKIKTALISVSDKDGIIDFAQELHKLGITIYSTGGTAQYLSDNNIKVINISQITGFPEVLDGRVKTLHPVIHAGLLAELDKTEHLSVLSEHNINSIDLLVVNLYPFEKTVRSLSYNNAHTNKDIYSFLDPNVIENIDIGGPSMLRSAAKNYKWSAPVVNPAHYSEVITYLQKDLTIPIKYREFLAGEVFNHTARYDSLIANYYNRVNEVEFPKQLTISYPLSKRCRYGENPHQNGAIYGDFLNYFDVLHGKELSYNNIMDISSACELMLEFTSPTLAIIKHTNPCGVASADNFVEAFNLAFATDTISPYGGIITINGTVDGDLAKAIHSMFTEVIIGTAFSDEALLILKQKKDRRLVVADYEAIRKVNSDQNTKMFRSIPGGLLYQDVDDQLMSGELRTVTERNPTDEDIAKMLFAWKVVKHIKSNGIVFADHNRTLGIGTGQTSRVASSKIAVQNAASNNLNLVNSAMASDAYLPFPDALLEASEAGASLVIQPGGSIRDDEVIEEANRQNMVMCFTGIRHFKH